MLRSDRIDATYGRHDILFLTEGTHTKNLLLHVVRRVLGETGDLEVGETEAFRLLHHVSRNILDLLVLTQHLRVVHDVLQLTDEPFVDFRQIDDFLDGIALLQSGCDGEDTQVGRVGQFRIQVAELDVVVADETVHTLTNHTKTLLHDLLERLTDGHDLTDRLHGRVDLTVNAHELGQVPTRDLHDDIINRWSDVSRVRRAHLTDLVEGITQSQLSGHESQRITGSLGSQSG